MHCGRKRPRDVDLPSQLTTERIRLRMHLPAFVALPPLLDIPAPYSIIYFGEKDTSAISWARVCKEAGELAQEADPEVALLQIFQKEFVPWIETEVPRRMAFVLDESGSPIATATGWFDESVSASPSARRGRVHWVSVVPRVQGQGLAKILLLHVLHNLRTLHPGRDNIFLTTQTTSARAIRMYFELGFKPEACEPETGVYSYHEQNGWRMMADLLQREIRLTIIPRKSLSSRLVVYLASPLGFSSSLKACVLPPLIRALENVGVEVYEPFERNAQSGLIKKGDATWAWNVAQADARAVQQCDAIFAVVNGVPPDEGVCVELGIAFACGKPTFLFRDDFRKAGDSETFPCNLMLMAGLPRDEADRRRFIYTSIDEIADQRKAFWQWVHNESERSTPEMKMEPLQ